MKASILSVRIIWLITLCLTIEIFAFHAKAYEAVVNIYWVDGGTDKIQRADPDGSIVSYEWQLNYRGDSAYDRTAQGEFATVSDLEPGFYDVILTVEDNGGATGTDEMECAAIGLKGDLDLDGDVDGFDLSEFAEAFGTLP